MEGTVSMKIKDLDFDYEHSPVKAIANRNCPEIKLVGLNVGPFEEGVEYEIPLWIAQELERAGIARIRDEERLEAIKLYKVQWTERIQAAGQISKLPENLYPKFRRHLAELKDEATKSPEKMREYEKMKHLARDIVNARLKKIVSLSSAPTQTEQTLKNLTSEERFLYEKLRRLIYDWRTKILEFTEVEQ